MMRFSGEPTPLMNSTVGSPEPGAVAVHEAGAGDIGDEIVGLDRIAGRRIAVADPKRAGNDIDPAVPGQRMGLGELSRRQSNHQAIGLACLGGIAIEQGLVARPFDLVGQQEGDALGIGHRADRILDRRPHEFVRAVRRGGASAAAAALGGVCAAGAWAAGAWARPAWGVRVMAAPARTARAVKPKRVNDVMCVSSR